MDAMDQEGRDNVGASAVTGRRAMRLHGHGFSGELSDGGRIYPTRIDDVSLIGVKVSCNGLDVAIKKKPYILLVSGRNHNHRLIVFPRWLKSPEREGDLEIGFRLVGAPWEWMEYLIEQGIETGES